jgi:carbonic anhydrase
MSLYNEVFERNKQWVADKTKEDPDFFTNLAKGQDPEFLFIGCGDSRVPANQVMGTDPGNVFVHRNIANIVSATDLNVMGCINFAVVHLNVKHIVVCGHYGCGGVKAAMQQKDLGILNPWLRNVRDVYRMHKEELNAIEEEPKRYDRLVELNVWEQCINVVKLAEVQKRYLADGFPIVHGWVYDLKTGLLKDLNLDFDKILHEIQEVYNLTDQPLIK